MATAKIQIQSRSMDTMKEASKNLGTAAMKETMTQTDWQQIDTGCRSINGLLNRTYIDTVYTVEHSVTEELLAYGG